MVVLGTTPKRTTKFILNLNNYRNVHYRSLALAKRRYKDEVFNLVDSLDYVPTFDGMVTIHYDYYHGNRRAVDVMNPVSVIDKFVCDALTEKGIWPDDNHRIVTAVSARFAGVDSENPRCEMLIKESNL